MFLIVPLIFLLVSSLSVAIMIWRKRSYLSKLYSLNVSGTGAETDALLSDFKWRSYWIDFFPEIKDLLDKLEFKKYKTNLLMEMEKIIRKIRLVFLRVDRLSESLIKKIRRVHTNGKINQQNADVSETIGGSELKDKESFEISSTVDSLVDKSKSRAFLKNEEERLIIEIAKNPKNSALYEQLGDLYAEMENFEDAKESYEACLELNPANISIKDKISITLKKMPSQK